MTDLVLEFVQPNSPVSINALKGRHRGVWTRACKPWKDAAWAHAHNAKVRATRRGNPEPPHFLLWPQPITIQVELRFRTPRRRDPHNFTGTVVKAIVDGIVRAGLVPDDTAEWVTVLDPTLTVEARRPTHPTPLRATITIRPRPPRSTP